MEGGKEDRMNEADLVANTVKTWLGNPVSRSLLRWISKRTEKGSKLESALKKYVDKTEKSSLQQKLAYLIVKCARNKKPSKESEFYFFTSIGNCTGESAASLEDFLEKIERVDIKSLEFHLYRDDFEKWLAETIGDKELAEQIQKTARPKPYWEKLGDQPHHVISKRYESSITSHGRN